MKKTEIKVAISPDIIKEKLKEAFDKAGEPHGELISRMIVENLATTEVGIGQLIFAFMGIEEKLPWLVGDTCLVHPDYISSWDCAKDEMIKRGHNMHKGMFIATIKEIDMRKERNIRFELEGLEKNSSKPGGELDPRKVTGTTPAHAIRLALDLPAKPEEKRGDVASIM
jgi:hypothetical protein